MTHILLVEDNDENWDMLSRRLIRRGFATTRAADGGQAVAQALGTAPDLVLMDVNLPVIDGLEATRRIRAAPAGAAMPIIALTAHALVSDRERAFAAGADDYHTKPVEFPELLRQIEALLAGGRMPR